MHACGFFAHYRLDGVTGRTTRSCASQRQRVRRFKLKRMTRPQHCGANKMRRASSTFKKSLKFFRRPPPHRRALPAMANCHLQVYFTYFLIFLTMFRCVRACTYIGNSVRSLSNHQVRCDAYQKEEAHSAAIRKSVAARNKQKRVQQKQSGLLRQKLSRLNDEV